MTRCNAARCGTAASCCGLILAGLLAGCLAPEDRPQARTVGFPDVEVYREPDPSADERYCAWYGDAEGGVLYFGEAAFWSSYRAAGMDPRGDLEAPGPQQIGRFDLAAGEMRDPLELGPRRNGSEPRSGVWDVLAQGDRVYFTTYFEEAGWVDLAGGAVTRLPGSSLWNELAPGPRPAPQAGSVGAESRRILVTRYAGGDAGRGAVLVLDPDGRVVERYVLPAQPGFSLAPKTPAWDPIRDEIWVTTDRLPLPPRDDENAPFAHPTLVLARDGRVVARFGSTEDPMEIQFVRFDDEGRGFLAVARGTRLELLVLAPEASRRDLTQARHVLLDDAFVGSLDFAQDIQLGPDGSAYVTRWSGRVHRVNAAGSVLTWQLPHDGESLYYTAVPAGPDGRICATRCRDVEVVCTAPDLVAGKR